MPRVAIDRTVSRQQPPQRQRREQHRCQQAGSGRLRTTTLTILSGTMMIFLGGLPSSMRATASSDKASFSTSSLGRALGHGDLAAALAVDLHRQRRSSIDQQRRIDLGPAAHRRPCPDLPSATQQVSARCGIIGRNQLHQLLDAFAHGGAMRLGDAGRAVRGWRIW